MSLLSILPCPFILCPIKNQKYDGVMLADNYVTTGERWRKSLQARKAQCRWLDPKLLNKGAHV